MNLRWLVLSLLMLSSARALADSPAVYIFVHTTAKPAAIEKAFEAQLSDVDVTAFGRIKDLRDALKDKPPAAVIARPQVLKALGLKVNLHGAGKTGREEPLVLVSTAPLADLSAINVGTIDLLGRKETAAFVGVALKLGGPPKTTPVAKIDDIMPLLQFKMADAVLVPASSFAEIKASTALTLVTKDSGATIGLPAVAIVDASLKPKIAALPAKLLADLGVSSWEEQ